MKKLICMLLALSLLLCGCGASGAATTAATEAPTETTEATTEAPTTEEPTT